MGSYRTQTHQPLKTEAPTSARVLARTNEPVVVKHEAKPVEVAVKTPIRQAEVEKPPVKKAEPTQKVTPVPEPSLPTAALIPVSDGNSSVSNLLGKVVHLKVLVLGIDPEAPKTKP